jgi:hypothetical protein
VDDCDRVRHRYSQHCCVVILGGSMNWKLPVFAVLFSVSAVGGMAANPSASVSDHPGVVISNDKLRTRTFQPSKQHFVPPQHDPSLLTIFSDLGTAYPNSLYFCCFGYTISGHTSSLIDYVQFGVQFYPAVSARITEIDAAYTYENGTHIATFGLYADAGNRPGTLLKVFSTKDFPPFGSCCALAVMKDKEGVSVTANTPYWLAGINDDSNQDEWGVWEENTSDEMDQIFGAANYGNGWQQLGGEKPAPAFAIYGH